MAVSPIPEGFHSVTISLTVADATAAIAFYAKAFGAREVAEYRLVGPDGSVMHAEVQIGDSRVMLNEASEAMGILAPDGTTNVPVSLFLYADDVDTMFATAVAAGATASRAPENEFYGHRRARVIDPFGHAWNLSQQIEVLTGAEMHERFATFMRDMTAHG